MSNPSIYLNQHKVKLADLAAGGRFAHEQCATLSETMDLVVPGMNAPPIYTDLQATSGPPAASPDPEAEDRYRAALELVRYIDRTQAAGSRHYRTQAGRLLPRLYDVIDAIIADDLIWPMSFDYISDIQRCLTAPIVDSGRIEHPGPKAEALAHFAEELRAVVDAPPEGYRQLHVQCSSSKSHGTGMAVDTAQIVECALSMAASILPVAGPYRIRYDLQLGQVREVEEVER